MPQLLKLKPGTRIVSHDGGIGDWPPDERLEMRAPEKPVGVGGVSRVELWIVPADARGTWTSEMPGARRRLEVRGQAEVPGDGHRRRRAGQGPAGAQQPAARHEIKIVVTGIVDGARLAPLLRRPLDGDRIAGEVTVSDGNNKRSFPWTATRTKVARRSSCFPSPTACFLTAGMIIGALIFKAPSTVAGATGGAGQFLVRLAARRRWCRCAARWSMPSSRRATRIPAASTCS